MNALPAIAPSAAEQSQQLPDDQSEWLITMTEKVEEAHRYAAARPWKEWCIYRLSRRLRDVQGDNKAYIPQTVSIGPYHHGSEQVRDMDLHKWVALSRLLKRTGQELKLYLNSVKEVEKEARACYQQELNHLSSNQFVEMMVLDACFILELFRCSPKVGGRSNLIDDPVFSNPRMVDDILLDMVMLENQIPLFVIDRLLGLIRTADNPNELLKGQKCVALALNLFSPEWLTGAPLYIRELDKLKASLQQKDCLHVLDVFRQSLLQVGSQQDPMCRTEFLWRVYEKLVPRCLNKWLHTNRAQYRMSGHGQVIIHSVTQLRKAGIQFRKRNTNRFWDIRFKNGVLEIPPIWIQDGTMSILLNVAAFEHCHLTISEGIIGSYVVFMECLMKSPEDVSYLHRRGILQHLLGHDAEVVDMFKSVSREILVDAYSGHYGRLSEQVNAYFNQRTNRWKASLLQKYFNNPWAIISLVAAILLLLLTATQTFFAVYSYYRPASDQKV